MKNHEKKVDLNRVKVLGPITHWFKIANGEYEYSTEHLNCLKVSVQTTFEPHSPICTILLMVSTQQNN